MPTCYETTCARYTAACSSNPQTIAPFTPSYPDGNFINNPRFRPETTLIGVKDITAGGGVYPDLWRLCPGVGATVRASLSDSLPPGVDQGLHLYMQWISGQWNPALECGATLIENYMYEFDKLAGHPVRLSLRAALDAGESNLIPCLWINYQDGDYEFLFGDRWLVTTTWQRFETYFQIPSAGLHSTNYTRYVAFGLTTPGPTAFGLHLTYPELVK